MTIPQPGGAKRKTGTREWADCTANAITGCAHGCLYCYARANALRFQRLARGEDWTREALRDLQAPALRRRYPGRVMFPSSHDVTEANLGHCLGAIGRLLAAGNELLIVSKPTAATAAALAIALDGHKDRVEFRFSITCLTAGARKFWEPGAPALGERIEALKIVHTAGFRTSVSCEPLLEPWNARQLVAAVAGYVVETIWIGKARELDGRTAWCRKRMGEALAMAIEHLQDWQTPSAVLSIAEGLRGRLAAETWAKVRFKDSYAEDLRDCGWQIEAGVVLKVPGETP